MRSAEQTRLSLRWPRLSLTRKEGHINPTATSMTNFFRVDGHDVYKTPSANLAVATKELARLPQTPKVAKVTAMLKAVHCQVNEIRQDQRPSYSTSSIR